MLKSKISGANPDIDVSQFKAVYMFPHEGDTRIFRRASKPTAGSVATSLANSAFKLIEKSLKTACPALSISKNKIAFRAKLQKEYLAALEQLEGDTDFAHVRGRVGFAKDTAKNELFGVLTNVWCENFSSSGADGQLRATDPLMTETRDLRGIRLPLHWDVDFQSAIVGSSTLGWVSDEEGNVHLRCQDQYAVEDESSLSGHVDCPELFAAANPSDWEL